MWTGLIVIGVVLLLLVAVRRLNGGARRPHLRGGDRRPDPPITQDGTGGHGLSV